MREMIIKSLDLLVWLLAGLIALAGVGFGIMTAASGQIQGLIFIIAGPLYAILLAGGFFIAIGIYNNTKRTAEAIEKLAAR